MGCLSTIAGLLYHYGLILSRSYFGKISNNSSKSGCNFPGNLLHCYTDFLRRKVSQMAEYELVREIPNLCPNNQMRDVFFSEVETRDPVLYVRDFLKDSQAELTVDSKPDGTVTVYAVADGMTQKFIFTPV